ncbi:MAG: hypothetical protein CM15mP125_0330 [Gammaproteobacteria bacterium]|nr:MAG: hypothetical protein CM15mP125_0330 [Gammaproteobacteria bacterium]
MRFAAGATRPDRVVGMHFLAPLMSCKTLGFEARQKRPTLARDGAPEKKSVNFRPVRHVLRVYRQRPLRHYGRGGRLCVMGRFPLHKWITRWSAGESRGPQGFGKAPGRVSTWVYRPRGKNI